MSEQKVATHWAYTLLQPLFVPSCPFHSLLSHTLLMLGVPGATSQLVRGPAACQKLSFSAWTTCLALKLPSPFKPMGTLLPFSPTDLSQHLRSPGKLPGLSVSGQSNMPDGGWEGGGMHLSRYLSAGERLQVQ